MGRAELKLELESGLNPFPTSVYFMFPLRGSLATETAHEAIRSRGREINDTEVDRSSTPAIIPRGQWSRGDDVPASSYHHGIVVVLRRRN